MKKKIISVYYNILIYNIFLLKNHKDLKKKKVNFKQVANFH